MVSRNDYRTIAKAQSQILSKTPHLIPKHLKNSNRYIGKHTILWSKNFGNAQKNDVVVMPDATHFDGKYHRAVQVLESSVKDDEGKIAKITRKGFIWGLKF